MNCWLPAVRLDCWDAQGCGCRSGKRVVRYGGYFTAGEGALRRGGGGGSAARSVSGGAAGRVSEGSGLWRGGGKPQRCGQGDVREVLQGGGCLSRRRDR